MLYGALAKKKRQFSKRFSTCMETSVENKLAFFKFIAIVIGSFSQKY